MANLTRNSKIAQSKAGAKVEPVKDEATLVVEDTGKVVKIEIMENASGSSNYDHVTPLLNSLLQRRVYYSPTNVDSCWVSVFSF